MLATERRLLAVEDVIAGTGWQQHRSFWQSKAGKAGILAVTRGVVAER
jgi:hypothetical protein